MGRIKDVSADVELKIREYADKERQTSDKTYAEKQYEARVQGLEGKLWWVAILIIGAVITAVLKLVIK